MSTIEQTILSSLVFDEEYTRKVLPYLKPEYFQNTGENKVFTLFSDYMEKYNRLPTVQALSIDLQKDVDNINEHIYKNTVEALESISKDDYDQEWLLDSTEKFCQEKAIYHGIMQSLEIIDDKSGKKTR